MEFWKFMFVPTILFMVIVAPMWITMHYRSVNRSSRSLNQEDRESIEQMLETADRLTDRIGAHHLLVVVIAAEEAHPDVRSAGREGFLAPEGVEDRGTGIRFRPDTGEA